MTRVPWLHVVTDDAVLARDGIGIELSAVLEAGGSAVAVHIRGPHTDGGRLFELAAIMRPLANERGTSLYVNDRIDIALAVGLDGIHLGQRSLPAFVARRLVGPSLMLGASVHTEEELTDAVDGGADYAFAGTLFSTPSHGGSDPRGLPLLPALRAAAHGANLIGIGGVTPERVASVLAAGAVGVAVVSGIWDADSPAKAVGAYLSELEASQGDGS